MMARLLIQNGQFVEAMSRLENYLRTNEADPEAHASLGEIAFAPVDFPMLGFSFVKR